MQFESIWKYLPKRNLTRGLYLLSSVFLLILGVKILTQLKPGKFEELLPEGNAVKANYQLFQKEFDVQDKIYLLVRKNARFFSVAEISEVNRQVKDGVRFFPEILKVETLNDRKVVALKDNDFLIRKTDEEARRHFDFWQELHISQSEQALLVVVTLKKLTNADQNNFMQKILEKNLLEESEYQTYWVGTLVSNYFFFKEQVRLQTILCPLILLVMSVFLSLLFHRFIVGLLFALNIVVIYFLLGIIIAYCEQGISPYSSFALFFTLIISTSDLIHLFYSWTNPDGGRVKTVLKRCLFTSITTVVAFSTFIFNSNVSIQELGKYSALGGILAFVVTFYLFPFSLKLWTGKNYLTLEKRSFPDLLPKTMGKKFSNALYFLAALSCVFIPQIIIDEDPYHKFSSEHYLNQGIEHLKKDFGFVGPLDLTLEFPQGELSQEVLAELLLLEKKLAEVKGVTKVRTLASLMNSTFYEDQSLQDSLPFSSFKNFSRILTNYQLVDYYYHPVAKKMRLEIFVNTTSSRELTLINDEISQQLKKISLTHLKNPQLVGFPQVVLSLYNHFKTDFFYSLGSSLLFIFCCFWVMLKKFRKALMAIIPNVFPLLVCAGIVGVLSKINGYALESNLLVINCVVLGIAVDDSIHFLLEFEEQKHFHDLPKALQVAEEKVGDSLKATTYVLLTAFMSFLFSDIVLFSQMGFLIAFSLWLALIADLWLLPQLILTFRKHWE